MHTVTQASFSHRNAPLTFQSYQRRRHQLFQVPQFCLLIHRAG